MLATSRTIPYVLLFFFYHYEFTTFCKVNMLCSIAGIILTDVQFIPSWANGSYFKLEPVAF